MTTSHTHLENRAKVELGRRTTGSFNRREILTVTGVLLLNMLLAALDQTIVSTAIPTIAGELHGLNQISWLVTAYLLGQTVAMPVAGKLGDLYGRKRLLVYATTWFLVGSALAGLSHTMTELIAFRAFQGLGGGALIVTAFAIIGDVIPARERAKYLALIIPIFGLATVFGPSIGGFVVDNFGWRWIFYINLPIGALAIFAALRRLRLPSRSLGSRRIDFLGAGLLGLSMSCTVLIAAWGGEEYPWVSPLIFGLICAVIASGVLFVLVERRAHDPIFPPDILRNRIVMTCMGLGIAVGVGLFGTLSYLPTFLQIARNESPASSGLLMLPLSLGLLFSAVTTGQLVSRTGRYKAFPIVGTTCGTIGIALLSTIGIDTPSLVLDAYMVLLGAGLGMVMPVLTQVAQNAVAHEQLGVATSAVNVSRQFSGAIGVAVAGTRFAARLHEQLREHLPASALAQIKATGAQIDPQAIAALPTNLHHTVEVAFGMTLPSIFLDFVPVLGLGILFALLLEEVSLGQSRRSD